MSNLFDRLQNELNSRQEEPQEGISVLDLVDLPAPLRKIMRLMLRKTKLSYSEIVAEVEGFNKGPEMIKPRPWAVKHTKKGFEIFEGDLGIPDGTIFEDQEIDQCGQHQKVDEPVFPNGQGHPPKSSLSHSISCIPETSRISAAIPYDLF